MKRLDNFLCLLMLIDMFVMIISCISNHMSVFFFSFGIMILCIALRMGFTEQKK